jgi:hypothetical protein
VTRKKGQNHTVTHREQLDIDNYMAHYNSKDHIDSSEENGDIPQILLLSIQRYHQLNGSSNENKINTQPIRFSDTITVPTTDGTQLQYTLTLQRQP